MTELTLEPTRRGSTERIKRLREISDKECTPSISMERAVLLTEAYKSGKAKFPHRFYVDWPSSILWKIEQTTLKKAHWFSVKRETNLGRLRLFLSYAVTR